MTWKRSAGAVPTELDTLYRAPLASPARSPIPSIESFRGILVLPFQRNVEHPDRVPVCGRQPDRVLGGGHRDRVGGIRRVDEPGNLGLVEPVMVRKALRRLDPASDCRKGPEEFFRTGDAGEGHHPRAGDVGAVGSRNETAPEQGNPVRQIPFYARPRRGR